MADKGLTEEARTNDTDFEPSYCGSLLKELDKQRRNGVLCDLSIFIHDSCFNLHSCVIRAKCLNYDVLMSRSQQSEGIGQSHNFVLFHDWSFKAFQLVTDFIYSGVLRLDSDCINNVHKIADYLGVVELQEACRKITSSKVRIARLDITGNTVHLKQVKSPLKENIKVEKDTSEYETAASSWSEQGYEPSDSENDNDFDRNLKDNDSHLDESEHRDRAENEESDSSIDKVTGKMQEKSKSVQMLTRSKHADPDRSDSTKDVIYECVLCKQRFGKIGSLTNHVRRLHCQELFNCVYCKFETKKPEVFYRHVKNIHKDSQPFRCPEFNCKAKISRWRDMDKHVSTHLSGRIARDIFHCQGCKAQFDDVKAYAEHLEAEHDWGLHKCTKCDKSFNEEYGLTWHMKSHYISTVYACKKPGCTFETTNEEEWKTHLEKKHGKSIKQKDDVNKKKNDGGVKDGAEEGNVGEQGSIERVEEEVSAKEGGKEEDGTKEAGEEDGSRMEVGEGKKPENTDEMEVSQEVESENEEMDDDLDEETRAEKSIKAIFDGNKGIKENCKDCNEEYRTKKRYKEHLNKNHIRQFECIACHNTYVTEIKLTTHIRLKHAPAIFECSHCEYETSKSLAFYNHVKQVHEEDKAFMCPELDCIGRLTHWKDLTRHIRVHANKKKNDGTELYLCNGCPEKFEKLAIYTEHLKEKHKIILHPCSVCGRSFRDRSGLSWHNKDHFMSESFICPKCPSRLEDKDSCMEHMKSEHDIEDKQIFCCTVTECNYLTIKKAHWKNHMEARHPAFLAKNDPEIKKEFKLYSCNNCKETFKKNHLLKKHIAEKHIELLGDKICTICHKRFQRKEGLTKHMRTTHFPEEYKCKHCEFKSYNITLYKKHVLVIHNDPRPFYCTEPGCEAQSAHCTFMKTHKVSHESERNYPCPHCSKSFRSDAAVHLHLRDTCLKLRSYLCDTCGAKFNHLSSLRSHQRVHNNEKPFSCDSCSATFSSHGNMRRHKRIHSDAQPYQCPHCDKKFRHSNSLKAHLKSIHQIEVKFGTSITDIPGVKPDDDGGYKYRPRKKWQPIKPGTKDDDLTAYVLKKDTVPIYRSKRQKVSDRVAKAKSTATSKKHSDKNQEEAPDRDETIDDLMQEFSNIEHMDNGKRLTENNDLHGNIEVGQYPFLSGMDFQLDMS